MLAWLHNCKRCDDDIILQVRQKIDLLKEEHQTLNNELSLYPPVSTATSSVININDVGQLSAELTVPHVLEPDAISARATVSGTYTLYTG